MPANHPPCQQIIHHASNPPGTSSFQLLPPIAWGGGDVSGRGGEKGTEEVDNAVGGGGEVIEVQEGVPKNVDQLGHLRTGHIGMGKSYEEVMGKS